MKSVTASEARKQFHRLLDEVAVSGQPVRISGKRSSAVVVPEELWWALTETLHLSSIPRMAASIRKGMETPVEECAEELDW